MPGQDHYAASPEVKVNRTPDEAAWPQTGAAPPTHLTVNSPTPNNLILNLRDYPAWQITLNQTPINNRLQRDDGLIAILIPAGPSTLNIHYTQTLDQIAGDAISLASLALLALLLSHRRTKTENKKV
jgi:hypothetical protein